MVSSWLRAPPHKTLRYIIVSITFMLYLWVFTYFHHEYGTVITSLALVPVILGSWYFGVAGGMVTAMFSIAGDVASLLALGHPLSELTASPGYFMGIALLFFVAFIVGRMAAILFRHNEVILRLEKLEKDRQEHANFLEFLNQITGTALESDDLESSLQILVAQIAVLFKADDCFFARWEETNALTIPMVAYGSFRETYPKMRFEPGEKTLTFSILKAGHPLAIADIENSPHIDPNFASRFSRKSMLGIPLIAQNRKLGALILGYSESRSFDPGEIVRAEIAAEQIALVFVKSQLLEEARKKVVELTTLHDVASASIQLDNEDQLIERATEIIGKNLYSDNFGILLLDGSTGILHPHPSYRFGLTSKSAGRDLMLGQGITGHVAETGQPLRTGNVNQVEYYLTVDERITSELAVPIKIKDRVLGVVNAESVKPDAFTRDDERLLTTLAGQLATAIEHMRKAHTERKWLDQLAHSNQLVYALAHVTTHIQKALTPDEIIEVLGVELDKLGLTCIVAVYDEERKLFRLRSTSMKPEILELVEEHLGFALIEHRFSLPPTASETGNPDLLEPQILPSPAQDIEMVFGERLNREASEVLGALGFDPSVQLVRLPLALEDNLLGILWIWGENANKLDLPILSIFSKQIATSLERARLFQEVQNLALTDPLTGLHNRRSLFELGKIEISRASRFNRPFGCLMLDLDLFKQVNDTYGHRTGDLVLHEFGKRCKDIVRDIDLVARYGGEELVILLPETEVEIAVEVAERIRWAICETPFAIGNSMLNITTSIGVSGKDENTPDLETLIARADQAMYIAKHRGRNRVAVSK